MSNRKAPWGASIVKNPGTMPTFKNAGLDWKVTLEPVYHLNAVGGYDETPHQYHVMRNDIQKPLGLVGRRYVPIQNQQLSDFTENIIDTDNATLIGYGVIGSGERVYSVTKLNKSWQWDSTLDETVDCYLFITNSHDGSSAFRATVFPMRLACTNGLRVTMQKVVRSWSVRHSGGVEDKVWEAKKSLGLLNQYFDAFEKEVIEATINVKIGKGKLFTAEDILKQLFPYDEETDGQRYVTTQKEKISGVLYVYNNADNLNNIRGTGWGLLNAVAEWEQWHKDYRSNYKNNRELYHVEQVTSDRGTQLVDHAYSLLA